MKDELNKETIQRMISEEVQKIFGQYQAVPRSIKQRHLEGEILFRGLEANRPDGSTHVKFYFATDTNVLSIWNGTAWTTHTIT